MTNYNAIAASPVAGASLNNSDIVVLNDPDNPIDNKATNLAQLAEKARLVNSPSLGTAAGAGITGGTGTVLRTSVRKDGGIFTAEYLVDLTGLSSSTTDLDIIGQGASPAYIGRILASELGTPLTIEMKCLEAPAGGVTDIDLYSATEATGVFDAGIGTLTETALLTSGGAWTNGRQLGATVMPAADQYLYLVGGAAGTAGAYTAGKFLITIKGYTP